MFFFPVQGMLLCNTPHRWKKNFVTISCFVSYIYLSQLYPCLDMKHLWPFAVVFWNKVHSRWKLSFKRQNWCSKFVACCTSVHLFIPDAHSTDWVCREQFTRKSTSKFTSKSPFRAILELSRVWPKIYKFPSSLKFILKWHRRFTKVHYITLVVILVVSRMIDETFRGFYQIRAMFSRFKSFLVGILPGFYASCSMEINGPTLKKKMFKCLLTFICTT